MIQAGAVVGAAALAACAGVDGPRLDSVTPAAAPRGAEVVIAGERLCTVVDGACEGAAPFVDFGLDPQIRAPVVTIGARAIRAVVPTSVAVGDTEVFVTHAGRSSNTLEFEVLP